MSIFYPQVTHQIGGNTAGATANVSTGTYVLAGGNNITLSQNGNSVTISAGAGGGGFQSAGFSTQGNTSGDTGFASQSIQFIGGNNITLSGSTAAGAITITISGPNAGGAQTGISGIQVSNTTYTSGTVTFQNANGISFGQSGAQGISASYTVPTVPGQFSGGLSNIGNTAGDTASVTGRLILAGGNNVTLSGSTNGASMTITVSGPNTVAQTNQQMTLFATGNTTQSSTGTTNASSMLFRGAGNVSVGITAGSIVISATESNQQMTMFATGNTTQSSSGTSNASSLIFRGEGVASVGITAGSVVISVPAGGGGFAGGGISGGNTSGDTGSVTARLIFAGGNNITLSGSTNGGSMTITISGGAGAGGFAGGGISGGNTSGDTGSVTGRLIFAGGNNVTLSGSTNAGSMTITISAAAGGGGGAGIGISNLGNTAGTSGTVTIGNYILVGSGAISLSQSSSGSNGTLSILAPATSSFVGVQGISVSTAGSTISIGARSNTMWFPYNEALNVAGQQGQGTLHFFPVDPRDPTEFDRVAFPVVMTYATNSTGSITASLWFGLYTKNAATLSLQYSSSTTQGITFSGTANSSVLSGIRLLTMGFTTTVNAGRYYVGVLSRTTSGGANATLSQLLISQLNSNFSGLMGVATNASMQWPPGAGIYSATTSSLPNSVGFSELRGTGSLGARPPSWFARSGTE